MNREKQILIVENVNDIKADVMKLGNYLIFDEISVQNATIEEIRLLDEIIQRAETIKELLTK